MDYQYISEQLGKDTNRSKIFTELMRRLQIRRTKSAFSPEAKQTVINVCPKIFCLKRENERTGERIYVIVNVSGEEVFLEKDEICGVDLLSGKKIEGKLRIEPWECGWVR